MFDEIDKAILSLLKENSKYTNKELGEKIHMTGQAVGVRISKLIEQGVIKRFTIDVSENDFDECAFIKIFITEQNRHTIIELINATHEITEAYFIASDNSYLMKLTIISKSFLERFLKNIGAFANYQLSSIESKVK